MTKPEMAAVALSAVACLSGVLAAVASLRCTGSRVALEQKLAKLESPPVAPNTAASGSPSNADLARELSALRSQIAVLSSRSITNPANPGEKPPASFRPASPVPGETKEQSEKRQQAFVAGMTRRIVTTLTDKLGLTEQQSSQIREIVANQFSGLQELRRKGKSEDTSKAIEALLLDTNEKIKVCLTPEQQAKYDGVSQGPGGVFGLAPASTQVGPRPAPENPR